MRVHIRAATLDLHVAPGSNNYVALACDSCHCAAVGLECLHHDTRLCSQLRVENPHLPVRPSGNEDAMGAVIKTRSARNSRSGTQCRFLRRDARVSAQRNRLNGAEAGGDVQDMDHIGLAADCDAGRAAAHERGAKKVVAFAHAAVQSQIILARRATLPTT